MSSDVYIIETPPKLNVTASAGMRKDLECALAMNKKLVLLDLRKTNMMDSAGLALIATAQKQLTGAGNKLMLLAPAPAVTKLLDSTGLLKVLTVIQSLDDLKKASSPVKVIENGFYLHLTVPEQFNVDLVHAFRTVIDEGMQKGYVNFVFDFSINRMITSVGLGILSNLQGKLKAKNGSVYIYGLSTEIRSLMEATNVLRVIPEFKSLHEIDEKLI